MNPTSHLYTSLVSAFRAVALVTLTAFTVFTAQAQDGSGSASEGAIGIGGEGEISSGSASGEASGATATYSPGNTDLGGSTVTLARAIFNGVIVSNGTVSASTEHEVRSGEVTAVLTGSAILQKLGSAPFTLNSASTYTGSSAIVAGTFKLGASGTIASTPSIRVVVGATFDVSDVSGGFALGNGQRATGGGNIVGPLTVGSSAFLAPGNSPGTLTFEDGLSFDPNSILDLELGSVSDLILVTGGTLADFQISDFTLGDAINGYDYFIDFNGNTLELSAFAVPEPVTYPLLAGTVALAAVIVRRRVANPTS